MEHTKKLCYLLAALFIFIGALALDDNLEHSYIGGGHLFNDIALYFSEKYSPQIAGAGFIMTGIATWAYGFFIAKR
ncbi:MAG: hypothetical protein V3V13_11700 [Paracoccaceae bacterium]